MNRIKLTHSTDHDLAERGLLEPDKVRSAEVEALVDTGATMLTLPADLVERLGFPVMRVRKARLANGEVVDVPYVGNVRFEVLGRDMTCDALVMPTGSTPLIGQMQLEGLDLIVDPKNREVRVNPESPDTPLLDLLRAG